ncbi:hypothetical protein LTS18_001170, partial [Coniosporium uncinatum]
MKLVKSAIERSTGQGSCTLTPEEPEDMWHAYNLIRPTDTLRASAIRRITSESATGSTSSQRVHTTISIRVTSTDFDAQSSQLHVAGKVNAENAYVSMGQHHTLDLELNRPFTLSKAGGWDSVALDTVRQACDASNRAELWAVVMQEGLANICLVTQYQTIVRQRLEVPVPKKRAGAGMEGHDKAVTKFHKTLLETLLRHLDLGQEAKPPLLLASPAHYAAEFLAYIKEYATTTTNKQLAAYIPSIMVTHASTGHVSALNTALSNPGITKGLVDAKFGRETVLMDQFQKYLRLDNGKAWYGPSEVRRAVDKGAVGRGGGVLLISNSLFRSQKVEERR